MNNKKGFVLPLVIAIIAILAIGSGIYVYKVKKVEAPIVVNTNSTTTIATSTNFPIGGDRDAHGCIGSAGYSWCQVKNKCLRVWEEKCDVSSAATSSLDTSIKVWVRIVTDPYINPFGDNYFLVRITNPTTGISSGINIKAVYSNPLFINRLGNSSGSEETGDFKIWLNDEKTCIENNLEKCVGPQIIQIEGYYIDSTTIKVNKIIHIL